MKDYRHGAHTVFEIHLHLVWITTYRRPALTGEVAQRVRELIRDICGQHGVTIMKGHVSKDHVPLFVSIPPQVTISRLLQWLKMLRLHRAGDDLTPRHGGGPIPLVQEAEREGLRAAVAKQPDLTLAEGQALLATRGTEVSVPTLCRALQALALPRKKKSARRGARRTPAPEVSPLGEGVEPAPVCRCG